MNYSKSVALEISGSDLAMQRKCALAALGASVLIFIYGFFIRYATGVHSSLIFGVEAFQLLSVFVLFLYGMSTRDWLRVFFIQLILIFISLSSVLLFGGQDFVSHGFWISILSPICVIVGFRKLGIVFLALYLGESVYHFTDHDILLDSDHSIHSINSISFSIAVFAISVFIKNWQNDVVKKVAEGKEELLKLEKQKHMYSVQMNHELRNPLAAIVSSADLLAKDYSSSEEVLTADAKERTRYLINAIKSTSDHVLAVLNDVLDMERIESGSKSDPYSQFSVRQLVREVIDIQAVKANEGSTQLAMHASPSLPDLWVGPASRIRQVLLNLTMNSLVHARGSNVSILISTVNNQLEFKIKDTGPGMSSLAMKNLFNPFSSSVGASGTTGLGLSICKMIVESQLCGSISVDSSAGQGTSFTVLLPLAQCQDSQVIDYAGSGSNEELSSFGEMEISASEEQLNRLKGKKLLLVEDDPVNSSVISFILSDVGIEVVAAPNSQSAMKLVKAGDAFDLALVDHNLGDLSEKDGVELTKDLKAAGIMRIFGHSGTNLKSVNARWHSLGVIDVLRKPTTRDGLILALADSFSHD